MTAAAPAPAPVPAPGFASAPAAPAPASLLARALAETGRLAALAAPLVAGLVASTGVTMVDTAMIGPLGATPLAAAGVTTSVLIVFYAALYGAAGPVGLFAGRAHGAGEPARIGATARAGAALALAAGLVGAGAMAAALPLLPALGQPPEVTAALGPYWLWMAAALAPFTLALAAKNLLDATDRPWTGVLFTALPVALNVGLNWLLIYGHAGFPAMGLAGAGLASFLAQSAGAAALWSYLRRARALRAWWAPAPLARADLRAQAGEGWPMALQYLAEGGAVAVAGLMIGTFGAAALAANQIAISVGATVYMLPLGMSAAVTFRVAQAVGAGETARAPAIALAGLGVVTLWMGACAALFLAAGGAIAAAFTPDPAVVALAGAVFTVWGVMQLFDGVQSVSLGALRGLLDNRWPTMVSILAYWLVALPCGWLFAHPLGWGAPGVWAGFGVGLALASAALAARLVRRLRRPAAGASASRAAGPGEGGRA
jgi:MATE family multidrug resistance protein